MQIFTRPKISLLVLACLGLLGNALNLPLFFGVDFLSGNIFVFLALALFGTTAGTAVAVVAGAYTYVLWGHPYAMIGIVLQALLVGIVIHYKRNPETQRNISTWVVVYWLLIGLPLITFLYHFVIGLGWQGALLIAFKQAINDVFNALIAALALHYLPVRRWAGLPKVQSGYSLINLQTNLLAAFSFFPALVVITLISRAEVSHVEESIKERLAIRTVAMSQELTKWLNTHTQIAQGLARRASQSNRLNAADLQRDLHFYTDVTADIAAVRIVDTTGLVVLSSDMPLSIKGPNLADRDWFQRLIIEKSPQLDLLPTGKVIDEPLVVFAAPILSKNSGNSAFLGAVSLTYKIKHFRDLFSTEALEDQIRATLQDHNGNTIISSDPRFTPGKNFNTQRGGKIVEQSGELYRWQPDINKTPIQAWSSSFYVRQLALGDSGWSLVVEMPLKARFNTLQQKILNGFIVTFFLALAAFLIGGWLGRRIAKPLRDLSRASTQLALNVSEHANIHLHHHGLSEIDTLVDNFTIMAQNLKLHHSELMAARRELEQRVEERTTEIKHKTLLLNEVLNSLPHGIAVYDEKLQVVLYNDHFPILLNYPADFMQNKPVTLAKLVRYNSDRGDYSGQTYESVLSRYTQMFEARQPVQFERKQANGDWLEIRGLPVSNNWSVLSYTDITARKQSEQIIIDARDEAERANHAKSDFLSSMSHELRTPMNAILGFGQLLQFDEHLSAENRDQVKEILKAGEHLLTLINEVLDLSRIEAGHIDLTLEAVSVRPLLQDTVNLMNTLAAKRNIDIQLHCPASFAVRSDSMRLKQVMLNLLSNAIKFNREGGSVKINVETSGTEHLRIMVSDTGKGIPAQRMAELFQPFNRLDAASSGIEGTGIGLSISRRIIEMMAGTIEVNSEVGVGSTFCIELPLEDALPEAEQTPQQKTNTLNAPVADESTSLSNVLYIEDNPSNIRLMVKLLSQRKHLHLLTAHTPELGLELAMTRQTDLILLDINMPGMDGYQVLQRIKSNESLKDIPVIAVTANAMPRDIECGITAGFSAYITKPIDISRFFDLLDIHLSTKH